VPISVRCHRTDESAEHIGDGTGRTGQRELNTGDASLTQILRSITVGVEPDKVANRD